jgi:hypothetical protein
LKPDESRKPGSERPLDVRQKTAFIKEQGPGTVLHYPVLRAAETDMYGCKIHAQKP